MQEQVDISDLAFNTLLKALWDNTITASFYRFSDITPPGYINPRIDLKYFDYHCGRPIKIDFSDPKKVSYCGYDRDAGKGKFLEKQK